MHWGCVVDVGDQHWSQGSGRYCHQWVSPAVPITAKQCLSMLLYPPIQTPMCCETTSAGEIICSQHRCMAPMLTTTEPQYCVQITTAKPTQRLDLPHPYLPHPHPWLRLHPLQRTLKLLMGSTAAPSKSSPAVMFGSWFGLAGSQPPLPSHSTR